MRAILVFLLAASCARSRPVEPAPTVAPEPRFAMRVLTEGLASPWEVFLGPDGWLWVAEAEGRRVSRVHPRSGEREVLLAVETAEPTVDWMYGVAFADDTLFAAYSYQAAPGVRRTKLASYAYHPDTRRFDAPRDVIVGLAADGDHASGRLLVGPDARLYYTIGDQGKNQFDAKCRPNLAQRLPSADEVARHDWSSYEGKLLRLEPDGSIPSDNPVIEGVQSHVYSYGHRNAQGLAFDDRGRLYASEHGPKTDDEINLISPGKNYGWPHVAGYRDDLGYEYANWSRAPGCAGLAYDSYTVPSEVPRQAERTWHHRDFVPPLATFGTVGQGFAFAAGDCRAREPACWPTIAPSSLAFYDPGSTGFASWGRALLVPSLKRGSLFVLRLQRDGNLVPEPPREQLISPNRYRALAVAPDRRTLYVLTDPYGNTSNPTRYSTQRLRERGALLEFTPIDAPP